jgi:hypothetical protein
MVEEKLSSEESPKKKMTNVYTDEDQEFYSAGVYEGRPESKDRLAIKKNKQNKIKKLMYHYYRPYVIFLHSRQQHSGTCQSV